MDRFQNTLGVQDTIGYEARRATLHGYSNASEPTQDLRSYAQRATVDPWALHLGSRPSIRHCQPMQDVYTL